MRFPWRKRHPVKVILDNQLEWMTDALDLISRTDPAAALRLARNIKDRMRLSDRDTDWLETPRDVTEMVMAALKAHEATLR